MLNSSNDTKKRFWGEADKGMTQQSKRSFLQSNLVTFYEDDNSFFLLRSLTFNWTYQYRTILHYKCPKTSAYLEYLLMKQLVQPVMLDNFQISWSNQRVLVKLRKGLLFYNLSHLPGKLFFIRKLRKQPFWGFFFLYKVISGIKNGIFMLIQENKCKHAWVTKYSPTTTKTGFKAKQIWLIHSQSLHFCTLKISIKF